MRYQTESARIWIDGGAGEMREMGVGMGIGIRERKLWSVDFSWVMVI